MKQKKDKKDKRDKKQKQPEQVRRDALLDMSIGQPMNGSSSVPAMQMGDTSQLMAQAVYSRQKIRSDVLGSYTGKTEKDEMPVQDADDL